MFARKRDPKTQEYRLSTQAILASLQRWDLHPVVDHFTISLLIVGVLIDLVASTGADAHLAALHRADC